MQLLGEGEKKKQWMRSRNERKTGKGNKNISIQLRFNEFEEYHQ